MVHTKEELTPFACRLIAASSLGIFIQQQNGHRYISIDTRELMDKVPHAINNKEFVMPSVDGDGECNCSCVVELKEYGSYATCLNRIDAIIAPNTLMDIFTSMNHYDDLNVFVGNSRVE